MMPAIELANIVTTASNNPILRKARTSAIFKSPFAP